MTRQLFLIGICITLSLVAALPAAMADGSQPQDPFATLLYPPELVMKHQASIALSAEQRNELIAEITKAQADLLPRQMEMAEFAEILQRLLAEPRVDEEAALDTATRIMELEGQIKQRHLRLAIRIKNLLTEEQQETLDELRR